MSKFAASHHAMAAEKAKSAADHHHLAADAYDGDEPMKGAHHAQVAAGYMAEACNHADQAAMAHANIHAED
jgi:hypothetical protein